MMKRPTKDYSDKLDRQILHEAYRRVLETIEQNDSIYFNRVDRCKRAYDQMRTDYFWTQQDKHTSSGEDCTCLDHKTRKITCKHMYTYRILEEYTKLVAGAVKDGMIVGYNEI